MIEKLKAFAKWIDGKKTKIGVVILAVVPLAKAIGIDVPEGIDQGAIKVIEAVVNTTGYIVTGIGLAHTAWKWLSGIFKKK
jgi:hypothetical protein